MPGDPRDRRSTSAGRRLRRALAFTGLFVALTLVAGAVEWALGGRIGDSAAADPSGLGASGLLGAGGGDPGAATLEPTPAPTPRPPLGGTELVGYLPYWQLNDDMLDYVKAVPLTTLELFSVASKPSGALDTKTIAYKRLTGRLGERAIREAHERDIRVELVFTSFGSTRNDRLFRDAAVWTRTARDVANLAKRLGVDGVNVDVELIAGDAFEAYTGFLAQLRTRLDASIQGATLSVATMANHDGATLARAAVAAAVDRVFLMGYEYHWSGSAAGASAPIDRLDGEKDLPWSIAEYVNLGVPRDRIVLGLPLYGMSWPIDGPDPWTASVTGRGAAWIPAKHLATLLDPAFVPQYDAYQVGEYFVEPVGKAWRATWYDSPRSLRPKLVLAREQGLAGAGFWALGYERGLPGYLDLMRDFRAGSIGG
jgi:spore germination protein YaaH